MGLLALKKRLLSLLTEEIKVYIPQFEAYTSDYQMVVYACRDFEEWMKCKWDIKSHHRLYEKLEETLDHEPKDFKVFLNFWVGCWLEKWRERVKVLSTKPKLPPNVLKRIRKARKFYREMEHGNELKEMVIRKLIRHGEICMTQVIAENLIIGEIAKRIGSMNGSSRFVNVQPIDIFISLSYKISRLSKEKGPLIYLNIKPYMF